MINLSNYQNSEKKLEKNGSQIQKDQGLILLSSAMNVQNSENDGNTAPKKSSTNDKDSNRSGLNKKKKYEFVEEDYEIPHSDEDVQLNVQKTQNYPLNMQLDSDRKETTKSEEQSTGGLISLKKSSTSKEDQQQPNIENETQQDQQNIIQLNIQENKAEIQTNINEKQIDTKLNEDQKIIQLNNEQQQEIQEDQVNEQQQQQQQQQVLVDNVNILVSENSVGPEVLAEQSKNNITNNQQEEKGYLKRQESTHANFRKALRLITQNPDLFLVNQAKHLNVLIDDEYFKADEQLDNDVAKLDVMKLREHDVFFNTKQFFEFLFYHIVFFFGLGPFSFLILFPIAGQMLTRNMGFYGKSTMFINQSIQWVFLFSSVALFYTIDPGVIQFYEVYMIIIAVGLRLLTIASKYGSTHPERIKLLKSRVLTLAEMFKDLMLISWKEQKQLVIDSEIENAIKRHEIDKSLFYFEFIYDVPQYIKAKLVRHDEAELQQISKEASLIQQESFLKENSVKKSQQNPKSRKNSIESQKSLTKSLSVQKISNEVYMKAMITSLNTKNLGGKSVFSQDVTNFKDTMLCGIQLAKELVQRSKKKLVPKIIELSLLIGFVRSTIPVFIRISKGVAPFGTNLTQLYMIITQTICNTYFFGANLAFIIIGISDLRLKLHLMRQCAQLISPRILNRESTINEYLPTMNIFDIISLKTWGNLRLILLDYGRKYTLRINLNISIFLLFYVIVAVILGLQFFGIIKTYDDPVFTIIFLFEVLITFYCMILMILLGMFVNNQFKIHVAILKQNKNIIADLLRLRDTYFDENSDFKPENYVYIEGIKRLSMQIGANNFDENLSKHLLKLKNLISDQIEELQLAEQNIPIKILGFTCNSDLVNQMFAALTTLGFAIVQRYATIKARGGSALSFSQKTSQDG